MARLRTLSAPIHDILAARMGWERLQGDRPAFQHLCEDVTRVSHLFTKRRDRLDQDYFLDGGLRAAYLAYFMPVNVAKVQSLLDELPRYPPDLLSPDPWRVLDVGSGPGTGALAALDWRRQWRGDSRGIEMTAVDQSRPALKEARALWNAYAQATGSTQGPLSCLPADLERAAWLKALADAAPPFDVIMMVNVVNELYLGSQDPVERRMKLVVALLERLKPDGTLIIVEPALRHVARSLHQLRNGLLAAGHGTMYSPCLHEQRCPALAKEEDWCHEERGWARPPWIAAIDAAVGFIKDALKFSYLMLRRDGRTMVAPEPGLYRMVSELRRMKGDTRAWLCHASGRPEIGRLDRDRSESNSAMDQWHRGAIVELGDVDWKPGDQGPVRVGRIRKTTIARVRRPADDPREPQDNM